MRVQTTPHFDTFCANALREPCARPRRRHRHVPITGAERDLYGMGFVFVAPAAVASTTGGAGAGAGIVGAAGGPIGLAITGAILGITALVKVLGPNPRNVPSAQAEQVFEAAAVNLENVAKAGMIGSQQAIHGQQQALALGAQYLQQQAQALGKPGQQAASNMTSVINAIMSRTQSLPAAASKPLDLNAARGLFVSGSNWYAGSLAAGADMAMQYLQSLAAQSGTGTPSTASPASALTSSTVPLGLLAAGALAILMLS